MKIKNKIDKTKCSLIVLNVLIFIFISYINIRAISILNNFYLMHGLPIVKYNHIYVTLYYVLFVLGITIKYSRIKKYKIKKMIYLTLFTLGFLFGVISIYRYYKVGKFISIFSYSSMSIFIISWIYHSLNKKVNKRENR